MKKIERGIGTTESERYLAEVADKTFLDLWSYPNVFFDSGKELCDLLVVCGDDVLIFSDKQIAWRTDISVEIAWGRWFRSAITKSAAQLHGAERSLKLRPDRVFLDPACTQPLPLELPPLDRRRVHNISIALGSEDAIRIHTKDPKARMQITPDLKSEDHLEPTKVDAPFFAIGDIDPSQAFVHVFDRTSLDAVMRELDTISDFTRYLTKRADLIRSGRLLHAPSEEDLLAYYLASTGNDGDHDFIRPDGGEWSIGERMVVERGLYDHINERQEYASKKIANKISYVWDRLIQQFTENVIAGTSVVVLGETPSTAMAESGLRFMAREPRIMRRVLGHAFYGAMQEAEKLRSPRFVRGALSDHQSPDPELAYVFLILAQPKIELEIGYEQYRQVRASMLQAYCLTTLYDNRRYKRIVGIAIDASHVVTDRKGGSEELIAVEIQEWTPSLEEEARRVRAHFDIFAPGRRTFRHMTADEYPGLGMAGVEQNPMNRQQRRVRERAINKALRNRE